ncbi:division/cell wall cluster transcriptional repressor MraZ [Guggenheimella bovis]
MFFGEFTNTVDTKGRVSVPPKFREELGECFYITKGLNKSLFAFPAPEWERYAKALTEGSITSPSNRAFSRVFLSGTSDVTMDRQGRILIPQYLREFAEIDKELIITGVGNRLELWAKENWLAYTDPENLNYDDLASNLENLGI